MSEWVRGGGRERGGETERDGRKTTIWIFHCYRVWIFFFTRFSAGPDETKVIRETQVGHLRAITAKRAHCLWGEADTASPVRKVKKSILVLSAVPRLCCWVLHNINHVNFSDRPACEGTRHEIDALVIHHHHDGGFHISLFLQREKKTLIVLKYPNLTVMENDSICLC